MAVLLWATSPLAARANEVPSPPRCPTPRRSLPRNPRSVHGLSLPRLTRYLVPDSRDYVQPTITADRDWLHLEARYNYEDLDTGSAWVGYNFGGGEKLAWEFTPMLGGVSSATPPASPPATKVR